LSPHGKHPPLLQMHSLHRKREKLYSLTHALRNYLRGERFPIPRNAVFSLMICSVFCEPPSWRTSGSKAIRKVGLDTFFSVSERSISFPLRALPGIVAGTIGFLQSLSLSLSLSFSFPDTVPMRTGIPEGTRRKEGRKEGRKTHVEYTIQFARCFLHSE
jgi:hypothetical protein